MRLIDRWAVGRHACGQHPRALVELAEGLAEARHGAEGAPAAAARQPAAAAHATTAAAAPAAAAQAAELRQTCQRHSLGEAERQIRDRRRGLHGECPVQPCNMEESFAIWIGMNHDLVYLVGYIFCLVLYLSSDRAER